MKNVKNNVIEVLKQCNDPELPIDLWNLGLIYDLKINEEGEKFSVDIVMSLTTPGCTMGQYMIDDIKNGKDVSYLLQADGLHPNPAGVKVIVEYISPQILKFLRKEKIIR